MDTAFDMGDVVVLETAQHVHDGIHLADVGEELVAEALALGRAAHQPGDVYEGDARRDDLLRLGDVGELAHARIGHGDFAGVGLDRAERIVRPCAAAVFVSALKVWTCRHSAARRYRI